MADPNYFVGRYPGAPLAVAPPQAPNQYLPRFDTNAHGATVPLQGQQVPLVAPGVAAVPAAAPVAAPVQANALMPATGPGGVPVMVPQPGAPIAPTLRAASLVANLPSYDGPRTNALQPAPTAAASGNGQVNLPPLIGGEIPLPGGQPGDESTDFSPQVAAGAGAVPVGPAGGGGGNALVPPGAAIQTGYEQQLNYQRAALQAIMEAARAGSPGNYSFRLAHLVGAMGNNNFGQVQGQGADALNQANASIQTAGTYADATRFGATAQLQGREEEIGEQASQFAQTPREVGNEVTYNAYGMPQGSHTTFAVPGGMANGRAAAPTIVTPSATAATRPIVGKIYRDRNGNQAIYQQDGTYKPVAQ